MLLDTHPIQTELMDAVDRIFTYLKADTRKGITYSDKLGLQLKGFVDSDFTGCEYSHKSTTGWVFTLAGGPIPWSSQRQKTIATSTIDAEYIACAEAAKIAVWIRNFINDLRIPGAHIETVPLYIHNNSALKLTRNPEFHSRSKHIDVKHHIIRKKVDEESSIPNASIRRATWQTCSLKLYLRLYTRIYLNDLIFGQGESWIPDYMMYSTVVAAY